jgi:glucose/arabinose dehydrogenase
MKSFTIFLCLSSAFAMAQTFGIDPYVTGLNTPVEITHAGDSRMFIVQKTGAIRIAKPEPGDPTNGVLNATNFLTLTTTTISTGSERGLLGLAFHPDYAENGYFFINYTRAGDGATVVARYSVSDDPDIADPDSGQVILVVPQPFSNHNGGTLKFGPDGYLYIGMGDGGDGGDPGNRAQNINENLGKMLRLDVDSASPYGIPPTNPFAGVDGNDEIWGMGLRNPWKFSFNRLTGDLWIADVGQGEHEEVNKIASPLPNDGINFGWRCYEGMAPYNTGGCGPSTDYTFPLAEFLQSTTGGCAVTGGYYYTGTMYPNFANKYIFGDYCLGKIMTLTDSGTLTFSANIPGLSSVTTFGEDINGELYVASNNNSIQRLVDTSLGNESFLPNGFSIYPNPASSEVHIRNTRNVPLSRYYIHDLTGKTLSSELMTQSEMSVIPVGSLQPGVYMLTLEDTGGSLYSSKLSIQQ